jgi:hypothetical protein
MIVLRRFSLVLFVLGIPPLLTAALYVGGNILLQLTQRVIDPQIPVYAAGIEFAAFFIIALFEARARW